MDDRRRQPWWTGGRGDHWLAVLVVLAGGPDVGASPLSDEAREHWAYRPIIRPALPASKPFATASDSGFAANPVDRFVRSRLDAVRLTPSPRAQRRVLIRRATLDLHGLPPNPEDVATFLEDARPDAYERLVDRLLASPRYGERWARHWLDLVRYAESDGYKSDRMRAGAWHYRDYVVRAFNSDKPYDRFVQEQLAGDELAPKNAEAIVATGFMRHWPFEDNGRHLHAMWQTVLDDVTDVTGQVFLGLTLGCARCHDHKFDAISRKDYFRLQAFFACMAPRDDVFVGSREEVASFVDQQRQWEEATASVRAKLRALEQPFRVEAQAAKGRKFPADVQRVVQVPVSRRSVLQRQVMFLAGNELRVKAKDMKKLMDAGTRERWEALQAEVAEFESLQPAELALARGVRHLFGQAPEVRVPDDPAGEALDPGFLSVLQVGVASEPSAPVSEDGSRAGERRAVLARWLTNRSHPLTARVMVNRLWQHHFGRGLVATPSDFGAQGARPTHPALLDWLACELMDSGWSLKAVHRAIMTSATYRQDSVPGQGAGSRKDPENRWLWRYPTRRVEAEVLRDGILATSGELNLRMYGPSAHPELPAELKTNYAWEPSEEVSERNRRSCYLVVRRNVSLPLLGIFDSPSTFAPCARRDTTTTSAQALVLLNSRWALQQAQAFAGRLLREAGTEIGALLDRAHELVYARALLPQERATAELFLREAEASLAERLRDDEPVALPTPAPEGVGAAFGAALVDYCHALWNTNEFIYAD